jgi:hypothetical protein
MKKLTLLVACALVLSTPAFAGEILDLSDPKDAVKAMQKIVCDLEEGKPATYWWTGHVYSRVPGEKDRLLFSYQAMNTRTCQVLSDPEKGYGFRMVSREALIYQDPKTGEIIHRWTNPWTGEELEVIHIFNDPVNSKYPNFERGKWGPFRFPATFKDGKGWFSFEVPLFYTNPLGGDYQEYVGGNYQAIEMFNFFFDEDELLDAAIGGCNSTNVSWARVSKWLPWMKMRDRAGQMIYNGSGKRVASWDELPEVLKEELMRVKPEFQSPPPVDDNRPNETSWTYFKKVIDAERAEGE